MDYKAMCINQGYVPSTCKMDMQMCWLLIKEGKDPCKGCNYNRSKCNGRHTPYESEPYRFDVFIDSLIETQRKKDFELELAENKKKAERQYRHTLCNAKVVLYINTEINHRGRFGLEIELKVNDLVGEKGYIKRYDNIAEATKWIPVIVGNYGVQQIQIDTNGYGKGIFEAIESLNLDIDIVPIIYQRMRLNH